MKIHLGTLFLSLTVAFAPSTLGQDCVAAPATLVGWWNFDYERPNPTNGTKVVNDLAPYLNHGYGTNLAVAAGKVGTALEFNGISSAVTVPSSSSLTVTNLTWAAWIFPTDNSPRPVMECGNENDVVGVDFWINTTSFAASAGTLYANVRQAWGVEHVITADGVITPNQWSFIALTYDHGSGLGRLYVNDRIVAEQVLGSFQPMTGQLNIGHRLASNRDGGIFPGLRFLGKLDEVQAYGRALEPTELAAIYHAGSAGVCAAPPTGREVALQVPTATFSQDWAGDFSVGRAIDGIKTDNLGWAIYPNITNQTAVFETANNVGFAQGTRLTFSLLFNHRSINGPTAHTLGRFRLAVTKDERNNFADGLAIGGAMDADWSIVKIISATSQSGAVLTPLEDGSILVSGTLTETDTYTVVTETDLTGITGIRLEALTDASLPFGGPGREPLNGNFVLAELQVTADKASRPEITEQPSSIEIAAGTTATFRVRASGAGPLIYQWFLNGARIPGATNSSIVVQNATLANAGTYAVTVNDGRGLGTSAGAILNVLPPDADATATLWVSNSGLISDADGKPLAGPRYLAQAYSPDTSGVFRPVSPATAFLSGANSGHFAPVRALFPEVTPGSEVRVQFVVWDSAFGTTYDEVVANAGARARSDVFTAVTGGAGLPIPHLQGLRNFALEVPPRITIQPRGVAALAGDDVFLRVGATGSDLRYQWSRNGIELPGASGNTLALTNLQPTMAGDYAVRVSNSLGAVTSSVAVVSIRVVDLEPPSVVITSPVNGQALDNIITATGTVTDNISVVSALFVHDFEAPRSLELDQGRFSLTNIVLHPGTNVLTVSAIDSSQNQGIATVFVLLRASRTVSIGQLPAYQEGAQVTIPIDLTSPGDVAGLTFALSYPPEFLEDPRIEWGAAVEKAIRQANSEVPGVVRASFALSPETLIAGAQRIANITFHARSVPLTREISLPLDVSGIVSSNGDSLLAGTEFFSGRVLIQQRKYTGDNNANDRLDVSDASTILRLVTFPDPSRPWDTAANDLNKNSQLDVGDVIRVLRTVVGLDPQPGGTIPPLFAALSMDAPGTNRLEASMSLDRPSATAGENVKLNVTLHGFDRDLSGASLIITYPTNALLLESPAGYRFGPLVPENPVALWNHDPLNGTIAVAGSSDSDWSTSNGVLAEFTFTVQQGATNQLLWPIHLTGVELSSGFELQTAPDSTINFLGRTPAASITAAFSSVDQALEISVSGEGKYLIQSSDDLQTWTDLAPFDTSEPSPVRDSGAFARKHRFYRAKQVQ